MPLAICVVCLPNDLAHSLGTDHKFDFGQKMVKAKSFNRFQIDKVKFYFFLLQIQNGKFNCFQAKSILK